MKERKNFVCITKVYNYVDKIFFFEEFCFVLLLEVTVKKEL